MEILIKKERLVSGWLEPEVFRTLTSFGVDSFGAAIGSDFWLLCACLSYQEKEEKGSYRHSDKVHEVL